MGRPKKIPRSYYRIGVEITLVTGEGGIKRYWPATSEAHLIEDAANSLGVEECMISSVVIFEYMEGR